MSRQNNRDEVTERDPELLAKIEDILSGKSSEERTDASLSSFCAHLASTIPRADDAFQQRLGSRLVAKLQQQQEGNGINRMHAVETRRDLTPPFVPPQPHLRTVLASALIVGLLLVLAVVVSPSRTWAQGTLNDLLSYFGFSRERRELPVAMEQTALPYTGDRAQPGGCSKSDQREVNCVEGAPRSLTRDEVQALVDFTVKLPTSLPTGYHEESGLQFNVEAKVVSWQAAKDIKDLPCFFGIRLWQSLAAGQTRSPIPIGAAPATAITVIGAPGLWIEKVETGTCTFHTADGKDGVVRLADSILTWERDGIRYWLAADSSLGLSEVLKVAESLR